MLIRRGHVIISNGAIERSDDMRLLIIDGQGGGMGRSLAERISQKCRSTEIVVAGTNSTATMNMMKVGNVQGVTGENAIVFNCPRVDVIAGPIGIALANAMLGEITPKMAEAVTSSDAQVFLLPSSKCAVKIIGLQEKKLAEYVDEVAEKIAALEADLKNK